MVGSEPGVVLKWVESCNMCMLHGCGFGCLRVGGVSMELHCCC